MTGQLPSDHANRPVVVFLALVSAGVSAAAAVAALSNAQLMTASLLVLAGAPWLAFLPWWTGWGGWRALLAAALSGLALGGLAAVKAGNVEAGNVEPPCADAAACPRTSAPPTTAPPGKLQITDPGKTIGLCTDFAGTGTIPDGSALLLFDRNATDEKASYFYNGRAKPNGDTWVVRNVQIGEGAGEDRGVRAEITVVLVNGEVADYIASIDSDEVWWSARLPGKAASKPVEVERNSDNTPCPGG